MTSRQKSVAMLSRYRAAFRAHRSTLRGLAMSADDYRVKLITKYVCHRGGRVHVYEIHVIFNGQT